MIVLYIFKTILEAFRYHLMLYLGQKLDIPLILGYYEHVLGLPMNFFGTRKVGEIAQGRVYEASICNWNSITASFGGAPEMIRNLTVFECPPFDTLLLTTDGIHDHLDHAELEEIMGRDEEESEKLERMIRRAQVEGSLDDLVTVIVSVPE